MSTAPTSCNPGAQPELDEVQPNTNALKHGFYSSRFHRADIADLDNHSFSGLKDEITLLRVYIRRVVENSYEVTDHTQTVELLRVISHALTTLNRLVRTQHALFGGETGNDFHAICDEVIVELMEEVQNGKTPWKDEKSTSQETSTEFVPGPHIKTPEDLPIEEDGDLAAYILRRVAPP